MTKLKAIATSFVWTDEAVAELKAMVAEGLSSTQMAAHLGVTRNSILGKVNKLQLGAIRRPKASPVAKPVKPPRPIVSSVKPAGRGVQPERFDKDVPRIVALAEPLGVRDAFNGADRPSISIDQLSRSTCRWPLDVPKKGVRYCGDPVDTGVYCACHAGMSYANAAHVAARSKAWHEARKSKTHSARKYA